MKEIIEKLAQKSPVAVMGHALLEHVFAPEKIDDIFRQHRIKQRERDWLFSSIVDLMTVVACKIKPSIHAAYQEIKDSAPASLDALYKKLDGIELAVSEALVRETARNMKEILKHVLPENQEIIPGYRSRIVDGNKLAATDRRLAVQRDQPAAPLPGFALAIYEPAYSLITDIILCNDGHTQERKLLPQLAELVEPDDLWFADRNFCCSGYLMEIAQRGGYFVIRQHASTPWEPLEDLVFQGETETGDVWEQKGIVTNPVTGQRLEIRRVEIRLKTPTRDGDGEMSLFSNLPESVSALMIADSYRKRWWIETAFQELESLLLGEIQTLCYPPAALFALSTAMVAYNVLQCLVSSIEVSHPEETREISAYHVSHAMSQTHVGLCLFSEPSDWEEFRTLDAREMGRFLLRLGAQVRYDVYAKRPPSKKKPARKSTKRKNHTSTAKLLKEKKTMAKILNS